MEQSKIDYNIESLINYIKSIGANILKKSTQQIYEDFLHRDLRHEKRCMNCKFRKAHVCRSESFQNLSEDEMNKELNNNLPYCRFFEKKHKLKKTNK
jgi:hypothetical protein